MINAIMKKRSHLIVAISVFIIILFLIPNASIFASSLEDQLEQIKRKKNKQKRRLRK